MNMYCRTLIAALGLAGLFAFHSDASAQFACPPCEDESLGIFENFSWFNKKPPGVQPERIQTIAVDDFATNEFAVNEYEPSLPLGILSGGESACPECTCAGPCTGACLDPWIDQGCGEAGVEMYRDSSILNRIVPILNARSLDDPYRLLGSWCNYSAGGWTQLGYHSKSLPSFNSRPHQLQLQQQWLYFEKKSNHQFGFDVGGRIDYVYGTDGPDTQSFGIENGHYDTSWDNGGAYGHALPQLYFETGYGDWNVKLGHFFTIIGFEVVPATGNFFYSHAYTMYNSEPFTHTGALVGYNGFSDIQLNAGYVLGWDSGFESNGDAFLGSIGLDLTNDIHFTYSTVIGEFSKNRYPGNESGSMHSIVTNVDLTSRLKYIFQADFLHSDDGNGDVVRNTSGINQYFLARVNQALSFGARFEWWEASADSQAYQGFAANRANLQPDYDVRERNFDFYAFTLGLNYSPHANVILRPELRWDSVFGGTDALAALDMIGLQDHSKNQATFGFDTIITF